MTIGFIGQGWIGKNLADHFENRGFATVRYAKEEPYLKNKEAIAACDIVFIAVPTPTTPNGFDDSALRSVLPLIGQGKIAAIRSTMLPGTTDALQKLFPDIIVLHVPEFLREATVRQDIDHPDRNIIGVPVALDAERGRAAAEQLLAVLPQAPYTSVGSAAEAEITKYASNIFLYTKVVFMNILYDVAHSSGVEWTRLKENMLADGRIGTSHMEPVHQIAHLANHAGRGAGGHCFLKDFAAFRAFAEKELRSDPEGVAVLRALEAKNLTLLRESQKDLPFLAEIYGS